MTSSLTLPGFTANSPRPSPKFRAHARSHSTLMPANECAPGAPWCPCHGGRMLTDPCVMRADDPCRSARPVVELAKPLAEICRLHGQVKCPSCGDPS